MIRAVASAADKQQFAKAVCGKPYFQALLGRDLALWADNPGAPVKLFVLSGAALAVSGCSAQLCGKPQNWEETVCFLRFAGVARLTTDQPSTGPARLPLRRALHLYRLSAGQSLPTGPAPEGLTLRSAPPVMEIAQRLFAGEPERVDAFYSEACTALAHGYAAVRALYDGQGRMVSTVGAYAMANAEAYMAMGETVEELRGQGIGGWLIPTFANELAAQGWQVTFLCEEKRRHFYDGLGFSCVGKYYQYRL